jgi:hypothetical protein
LRRSAALDDGDVRVLAHAGADDAEDVQSEDQVDARTHFALSAGTDVTRLKKNSTRNSAKNFSAEKLAFLTQSKAKLCTILIIKLVFEKNTNCFCRKWSKIAENCDHNNDPC